MTATGVATEMLLCLSCLMRPEAKRKAPLGRGQHGLAGICARIVDIAVDADARLLAEGQNAVVVENDLQPPFRSRAQLIAEMDGCTDACRGRGTG